MDRGVVHANHFAPMRQRSIMIITKSTTGRLELFL